MAMTQLVVEEVVRSPLVLYEAEENAKRIRQGLAKFNSKRDATKMRMSQTNYSLIRTLKRPPELEECYNIARFFDRPVEAVLRDFRRVFAPKHTYPGLDGLIVFMEQQPVTPLNQKILENLHAAQSGEHAKQWQKTSWRQDVHKEQAEYNLTRSEPEIERARLYGNCFNAWLVDPFKGIPQELRNTGEITVGAN